MQEAANKQKHITLKTLHEMLDGMSVELAEKVHLLSWQMRWISTWKYSTLKPTFSVTCTAAPASQTCYVMPKPNTYSPSKSFSTFTHELRPSGFI